MVNAYYYDGVTFTMDFLYYEVEKKNYNLVTDVNGWLYYYYLIIRKEIYNPELLGEIIYIIDNWRDDLIKSIY
jgi:hypothetical protein